MFLASFLLVPVTYAAESLIFENDSTRPFNARTLIINNQDRSGDVTLQFGKTLSETFFWDTSASKFKLTDDLDVQGTLSGAALTVSNLLNCDTIDTDASGNLSCGTDSGGDLSQSTADDRYVNQSGDTMTGTLIINQESGNDALSASGAIKTESGFVLNYKNAAQDAVLTFGNDAAAETLTFSDTFNEFAFSDDVRVGGNLSVSGSLAIEAGNTIALNGVAYTFPSVDGAASGNTLKTNASGVLTWSTDDDVPESGDFGAAGDLDADGTITDGVIDKADLSASTDFGNISTDGSSNLTIDDGTIIEPDLDADVAASDGDFLQYDSTGTNFTWRSASEVLSDLGQNAGTDITADLEEETHASEHESGGGDPINHDNLDGFVANEHINWVVGGGASANFETTGTASGSTFHGQDSLTSSGVLSIESTASLQGAVTFGSTINLGSVTYTFPGSDGSSSGRVLSTDSSGQLSWALIGTGALKTREQQIHVPIDTAAITTDGTDNELNVFVGSQTGATANPHHYYRVETGSGQLQDIDIRMKVLMPKDFVDFSNSNDLTFSYRTGSGASAVNKLDILVEDDDGDDAFTASDGQGLVNTSWTDYTDEFDGGSFNPAKSEYIHVTIKAYASSNEGMAYAGEVIITYTAR